MQHVLIVHEVQDYPHWKKIFDEAAGIRHQAGERVLLEEGPLTP